MYITQRPAYEYFVQYISELIILCCLRAAETKCHATVVAFIDTTRAVTTFPYAICHAAAPCALLH